MMKLKISALLILSAFLSSTIISAQTPSKREFRGTWVHTVGQKKYAKMSESEMKAYFTSLLDSLKEAGINTVIFQVRPEADAWYKSQYEPWSRYITGTQGKDPGWDPLAFMVSESHKRGMDIHAWLNPYRVKANIKDELSPDHIYYKKPEWFVEYGNYLWFNPGIPECRRFIEKVVKDIVTRYDIDAIHMDDYFYPYPEKGISFNDDSTFAVYGKAEGFGAERKNDWRRENVTSLIKDLHEIIHKTKPWVQLGISPFGIYQNHKRYANGSNTNGLTNYDDLYADILLWMKNGWVDYVVPQLYWEIGHRSADYKTLIKWWEANSEKVPLYIGQDIIRTVRPDSLVKGQLKQKMELASEPSVMGNCFWPAYELEKNSGGIMDSLRTNYYKYPALVPAINPNDKIPPRRVRDLTFSKSADGSTTLKWCAPFAPTENDKAERYVVYRADTSNKNFTNDPDNIVAITGENKFVIPSGEKSKAFIVTALDHSHNEGKGAEIFIR